MCLFWSIFSSLYFIIISHSRNNDSIKRIIGGEKLWLRLIRKSANFIEYLDALHFTFQTIFKHSKLSLVIIFP